MESPDTVTEILLYGGFRCPHCGHEWLTPKGWLLVPGECSCRQCSRRMVISQALAARANHARTLMVFTDALLGSNKEPHGIAAHG